MQAAFFDRFSPPLPPPSQADDALLVRLGVDPAAFRRWFGACFWLEESPWETVINEFFHTMYRHWLNHVEADHADFATAFHKMGMTEDAAQGLRSRIQTACGGNEALADGWVVPHETGKGFVMNQLLRLSREEERKQKRPR